MAAKPFAHGREEVMGKYRCTACGVEFELTLIKPSQSEEIGPPITCPYCDSAGRFLDLEEEDG